MFFAEQSKVSFFLPKDWEIFEKKQESLKIRNRIERPEER